MTSRLPALRMAAIPAFALVMAVCPFFLNAYWIELLNNVGLYAILGLSLNIILRAMAHQKARGERQGAEIGRASCRERV